MPRSARKASSSALTLAAYSNTKRLPGAFFSGGPHAWRRCAPLGSPTARGTSPLIRPPDGGGEGADEVGAAMAADSLVRWRRWRRWTSSMVANAAVSVSIPAHAVAWEPHLAARECGLLRRRDRHRGQQKGSSHCDRRLSPNLAHNRPEHATGGYLYPRDLERV